MYNDKKIGNRLKQLRIGRGDTPRADVAAAVFLAEESCANIERGSQKIPLATAVRLAAFFGVTLDYLVLGIEHNSTSEIVAILKEILAICREILKLLQSN